MNPDIDVTQRQVNVVCPRCQTKGKVAWDRLDRLLRCAKCESWYKLSTSASLVEVRPPSQKIQVAVRTMFSEWSGHELTLPQNRKSRSHYWQDFRPREWWSRLSGMQSLAFVGSTLLAIFFVGWSMTQWMSSVGASVPEPLPAALNDRAGLFAHAWLDGDLPQMLRLTEPARDRDLRRWIQKTPSPAGKETRQHAMVEVASMDRKPTTSQVVVNIKLVDDAGSNKDIVQQQAWVQKHGVWYFLPTLPPTKKTPYRQPMRT